MKRDKEKEREKDSAQPTPGPSRAPANSKSAAFDLQRKLGNQAILQLLDSGAAQAKQSVSQPGDADELEADRMAEQVTSGSLTGSSLAGDSTADAIESGKSVDHGTNSASVRTTNPQDSPVSSLGSGRPLDSSIRKSLEPRLGSDFGGVRVHTNEEAASTARALNARAFTLGNDVVFNSGEYVPSSLSGKKLIAHELVHVAQNQKSGGSHQQGGASATIKRESIVGKATSFLSEKKEAAGKYLDAKKWDIYRGMIAGMKSAKNFAIGKLRTLVPKLPQSMQGAASTIINALDFCVDIINALLLAITGLAVGFVTGIVDLVTGLVKLVLKLLQMIVDAFVAILGQPDDFKQDWNDLGEAIRNIPAGIKKLADDWIERYKHATLEEQVLMGGELVGQIEAFLATFALAGTKAGQATSLTVRTGMSGARTMITEGGAVILQEAPATVTIAVPAVIPKTAAEAAVVTSQAMMMSAAGQGGGSGGGRGSGSKESPSKTPKSEQGGNESDKGSKTASKAQSEEARLQKKYGERSKTSYPANEWKRIEQLESRFPKLKSARLRPIKRPGVGDEAIFEERMQTGQGGYSLAAYSEDGEQIIQFDGISPEGFVEEVKIEQASEKVDEIVTQLRRQADFARAYGLKGVEYSINPPAVAAEVESRVAAEQLKNVYRTHGQ
ncbi:MAG TPA: DUF4157 domain-containing protein [Candidatus Saccharimonadales bacterium]|nr:DUF4157 domain-containing protein [Candidatus Saccharimonadales bacterium]